MLAFDDVFCILYARVVITTLTCAAFAAFAAKQKSEGNGIMHHLKYFHLKYNYIFLSLFLCLLCLGFVLYVDVSTYVPFSLDACVFVCVYSI